MLRAHRERHRRVVMMGGFLPNQISNLGFWLESDYGITKDGSNAVSEWIARGSRGYTLSQATGANQPIWTANEFGSQAGLIFDGTNDSLERSVSNPFGDVQNYSCFIVCKPTTGTGSENYFMMGDLGSTDFYGFFKIGTGNTNAIQSLVGASNNWVRGSTVVNDNTPHLLITESDGSAWSKRIDRVNQTITIGAGSNNGIAPGDHSNLDNITLGVLRRSSTIFVVSNFAAVLFYERQLSTAERTRVENYLISKYGIAA